MSTLFTKGVYRFDVELNIKQVIKSVILIIFGLLLGLITLEIGLRLLPETTILQSIARRPQRFILYETTPDIGWRLKPNATMRYTGVGEYDVQVQINSNGLNDLERSYKKPQDTYRILMLGDSFTEGISVPIPQGFPQVLETCLDSHYEQSIEVINSGTAYYATAEELFFLEKEGIHYEPDLVLLAFYIGNDIDAYDSRMSEDKWFDGLGGYLVDLDETGQMITQWIDWKNPSPYDEVSDNELFLRRYSKIYLILNHSNSRIKDALGEWQEDLKKRWFSTAPSDVDTLENTAVNTEDYQTNLELMRFHPDFPYGESTPPQLSKAWAIISVLFSKIQETTTSIDSDLGVLIIPEKAQASSQHYQQEQIKYSSRYGIDLINVDWQYDQPNQALTELLNMKSIATLDLLPHFRNHDATQEPPLYFEIDSHFNEAGHKLTGELACDWIIEQNFINP